MANEREDSVERTSEYNEFIAKLAKFHEERGTPFDPAPKVGVRRIDLLRLYKKVTSEGGYDIVSNTKLSKLAWRRLGDEFKLADAKSLPTLAFQLKTAYYKNVVAFEIADFHKKEPPPREILEDVSAKGSDVLGRTLENFKRPISHDESWLNGGDREGSHENGQRTPGEDKMDLDDPGSGNPGGRSIRGLRQAPPQRVLFQSDTSMTRQTRQASGSTNSPTPSIHNQHSAVHGSLNLATSGNAQTLLNYEPKSHLPMTVRPVTTLANNPALFKANQKALRHAHLVKSGRPIPTRTGMVPGTGYEGPEIWGRTTKALLSRDLEEQEYALLHMVGMTHQQGDKLKFNFFPGVAEALIEKVLEVGSFFSDVDWTISFRGNLGEHDFNTIDALNGTSDILEKVRAVVPYQTEDKIQPEEVSRRLMAANEAGLVLRNMVMLEENAVYLAEDSAIRDTLIILLSLPPNPACTEIRHYACEIAEQLTRFFPAYPDDALLQCLLECIRSTDRGIILPCLRAASRMGMNMEHILPLQNVPLSLVKRISEWILVEDDELRSACLDFLYRYTAVVDNVEILIQHADIEGLVRQLARLLMHGSRTDLKKEQQLKEIPKPPPVEGDPTVPRISSDLVEQLLGYDEPDRSSQWLRACFQEDSEGEITQIALWQAYQIPFAPYGSQRPLLAAKDFITNVSDTFQSARAQVVQLPDAPQKFVIKGIRPRKVPVDPRGRQYMRCRWHSETGDECGVFQLWPKQMWEHCLRDHLNMVKSVDGQYDFEPLEGRKYVCKWAGCTHFDKPAKKKEPTTPFEVGMHLKTHLPDSSSMSYQRSKHNVSKPKEEVTFDYTRTWPIQNTEVGERFDPTGLPLSSALVLRNLARNIPKTLSAQRVSHEENYVWQIFVPIKDQIYYVMAHNQPLRDYLVDLTHALMKAENVEEKVKETEVFGDAFVP